MTFNFYFQVKLSDIKGTGKDGRILKEDVFAYLEQLKSKQSAGNLVFLFLNEAIGKSNLNMLC